MIKQKQTDSNVSDTEMSTWLTLANISRQELAENLALRVFFVHLL